MEKSYVSPTLNNYAARRESHRSNGFANFPSADSGFTEVKGRLYPAIGLYSIVSTVVNFGADKEKKFLWEPANGEDFRV
jgi:hypothetical protein